MATQPPRGNHAFIDGQNLYLGVRALGWELDYRRLRRYLADKYNVRTALIFIGYIPRFRSLYRHLEACGFELIYKEIDLNAAVAKGNVDVDLTLHTLTLLDGYERAVLITSDGDFAPLVRYLMENNRLEVVLSPSVRHCSWLLKKTAREKVRYLQEVRSKVDLK